MPELAEIAPRAGEGRGIPLGTWIRALLFLPLVSVLATSLSRSIPAFSWIAWIATAASTLYGFMFICKLSWTLLSRHVLPYRVQDYVSRLASYQVLYDSQDVLVQWGSHSIERIQSCASAFFFFICHVPGNLMQLVRERVTSAWRTGQAQDAQESSSPSSTEVMTTSIHSLTLREEVVEAPVTNEMERSDTLRDEEHSPLIRDKKEW